VTVKLDRVVIPYAALKTCRPLMVRRQERKAALRAPSARRRPPGAFGGSRPPSAHHVDEVVASTIAYCLILWLEKVSEPSPVGPACSSAIQPARPRA
jgi:hypothetical protein